MKNSKWGAKNIEENAVYVALFVSRNKDNKYLPSFKERRKAFIYHASEGDKVLKEFDNFVKQGLDGEMSRLYVSVNERDMKKTQQKLIHYLIDNPDFDLCNIQAKVAGFAAQKDCAATKHWMFDFDCNDANKEFEFECDIYDITGYMKIDTLDTPNGYCVIVDHGFDTRKLMKKWGDIATLKKDDFACVYWERRRKED